MKVLDCEQGSDEWIATRLGIPTASQFSRIITAKTLKVSESSASYMCELLAERMLGMPVNESVSGFMERGSEMEASAVAFYELQRGVDTQKVGLVLRDDGRVGCSPDRFVGDDGGLEIKCPSAAVHVAHLLEMPLRFFPQVQGCLWLTERKWWDLLSYHPQMPPALVRVERDEEFIAALATAVEKFLERLDLAQRALDAMGCKALAA